MPHPSNQIQGPISNSLTVPPYVEFLASVLPHCLPTQLQIDPQSVRHLRTGGENFVFRASSTIHGDVCIRLPSNLAPHLREASHEHRVMRTEREFQYLQMAHHSGATVPKPIAYGTLSNDPAAHSFVVCSWLEGRPWDSRTDNTPEFWRSLGTEVAKLHSMELQCDYSSPWDATSVRDWPGFVNRLLGPWIPDRAQQSGAITEDEAAAIRAKLVRLMTIEGPTTFNHGDLHCGNLLVSPEGRCAGLLDLGLARILNGPWEDLARLRVTIRQGIGDDPQMPQILAAMIEGYQPAAYNKASPVVDIFELAHLCNFLTWPSTLPGSKEYQRALQRMRELY